MALLQFTTNWAANDPAAIHSACRFDETDGLCTAAERENPQPLRLLSNASSASSSPLSTNNTTTTFSDQQHSRSILNDISPTNPAILLARPITAATAATTIDTRPFVCSAITIVSSARTMELYISGEYSGTFRGESFLPSTPSFTPTTIAEASPPLFLIQIDQESLLQRCRNLLFKFFVPKKPAAFQDSLSIHWLIVQGALPPPVAPQNSPHPSSSPSVQALTSMLPFLSPLASAISSTSASTQPGNSLSLTQSDGATVATATFGEDMNGATNTTVTQKSISPISEAASFTSTSEFISKNLDASHTSPNFLSIFPSPAQSYISPPGNSTSTIDVDKVRQMLSQVQIDNMPQGAKDLMRTMEMQSLAQRASAYSSSSSSSATASSAVAAAEIGGYLSPSPTTSPLPLLSYMATPPPVPALPTVATTVTSSPPDDALLATTTMTYVTRGELALMEDRILAKIEQRFQEMEETILNKLLAAKQPHA
ncbi:MAG: hypothetical protein J3R72DRAFT_434557 [Linnemannia gamsii]|nr:MAG: hypothetical protein J3R72DRAFT_434557 [Linnemannia gamsii]